MFTWTIGGESGEGIDSTGEVMATALHRVGYYIFAFRHFPSRIKGGHTNYKVRLSDQPVFNGVREIDFLVAFDEETMKSLLEELNEQSIVVYDKNKIEEPDGAFKLYGIPLTELAEETGTKIQKNMVALGVSAAYLDLSPSIFNTVIKNRFQKKGDDVIRLNQKAVIAGYNYARENLPVRPLKPTNTKKSTQHFLMSGNEALACGALTGGCRFLAAYPITPATEIMYWMIRRLPDFGGVVIQAEDEIAAANMALGAAFTGARAMTSTSGPGLSLMGETVGLSGITETPLVVIDVQRAGPSTGLPTKPEQSNLNQIIYGGHGDFPRVVLAPANVAECYHLAAEAFNIAEYFQCPVFVVIDQTLGLSKQSTDDLNPESITIRRGNIFKPEGEENYFRYLITTSGISPRAFPGVPGGTHVASSYEHDESGFATEDPKIRIRMMDKRLHKLDQLDLSKYVYYEGPQKPKLVLAGWGSTFGPLKEAQNHLHNEKISIGHLHLSALQPFPTGKVRKLFTKSSRILVVENNATGQMANLFKIALPELLQLPPLLKYDGAPFTPEEIYQVCRKVI